MQLKEIYNTLKENELRGSEADVFKRAIAGMVHLTNSYTDLQIKELMPDTAGREGLERWAKILGISIDKETDESDLRRKILKRLRTPQHGGCRADFEEKVEEADERVKQGFCFPTTDPSTDTKVVGNVTVSAIDKNYQPITDGNKIKEYVEENSPLSIKVHYRPVEIKEIEVVIYTYARAEEQKEWKDRVERLINYFFNNHEPGGITKEHRIYHPQLHALINKAGSRNYTIRKPPKDITLRKFEVPRLKGGKVIWKNAV